MSVQKGNICSTFEIKVGVAFQCYLLLIWYASNNVNIVQSFDGDCHPTYHISSDTLRSRSEFCFFFSHKAKYIIIEDTNFILEAVQKHFYYFIQLCPFLWLIYKTPSIIIKIFLNPFTRVLKPYYYIFLIRCGHKKCKVSMW